jgi:hypothetical protein
MAFKGKEIHLQQTSRHSINFTQFSETSKIYVPFFYVINLQAHPKTRISGVFPCYLGN